MNDIQKLIFTNATKDWNILLKTAMREAQTKLQLGGIVTQPDVSIQSIRQRMRG